MSVASREFPCKQTVNLHLAQKYAQDKNVTVKFQVFPGFPGPIQTLTESFDEQIMSKDKYLSIFLHKMEAIVLILLQIFFTTRAT